MPRKCGTRHRSSAHSNVAFGPASEKVKVADVMFVEPEGPLVIFGVALSMPPAPS